MALFPSWKAAALDALGAVAVLALDLPFALLDQAVSPAHRAARLVVAVLVALAVLLARRRMPLVLLGLAVVDVLVKYTGSWSLGWAAYAVARHQRNELVAIGAFAVALVVGVKVWTWDSPEAIVLHVRTVVLFVAVPAAAGFLVRALSAAPPGAGAGPVAPVGPGSEIPGGPGLGEVRRYEPEEPERLPRGPDRPAPDLLTGLAELDAAARRPEQQ